MRARRIAADAETPIPGKVEAFLHSAFPVPKVEGELAESAVDEADGEAQDQGEAS